MVLSQPQLLAEMLARVRSGPRHALIPRARDHYTGITHGDVGCSFGLRAWWCQVLVLFSCYDQLASMSPRANSLFLLDKSRIIPSTRRCFLQNFRCVLWPLPWSSYAWSRSYWEKVVEASHHSTCFRIHCQVQDWSWEEAWNKNVGLLKFAACFILEDLAQLAFTPYLTPRSLGASLFNPLCKAPTIIY